MRRFYDFKKNKKLSAEWAGSGAESVSPAEAQESFPDKYLDDDTYIRDMHHDPSGSFHVYDILLNARGYGWDYMLDSAEYIAEADLVGIQEVLSFSNGSDNELDVTEQFHAHGGKCTEVPELKEENGCLSVAGYSSVLKSPLKVVWFNQTNILRVFSRSGDEELIKRYVETLIRHSFGTEDEMKLGRPVEE